MLEHMYNGWMSLSLNKKLSLFTVVIITAFVLFSFIVLREFFYFIEQYNDNNIKNYNILNIQQTLDDCNTNIDKYIKTVNMEELNNFNNGIDTMASILVKVEREESSMDAYLLINSIRNSIFSYREACNNIVRMLREKNSDYYIYYYTAKRISMYINSYISDLLRMSLYDRSSVYAELRGNAKNMIYVASLIAGLILGICILFLLFFKTHLIKPINELAGLTVKMSRGILDVNEMKAIQADEIGVLVNSFNSMNKNIKRMVKDLTNKAILEKKLHDEEIKNVRMQQFLNEANYLALQSQIHSHFLFNVLNTISRVITFGKPNDAIQLIESLCHLLRYNLNFTSRYTKAGRELNIIREYLKIQQYRFGDRLCAEIICSKDDEETVNIPYFILQPLVENAVIHGIESKENGGCVRIKITKKKKFAQIKIIDNGIGIHKDILHKVLSVDLDNGDVKTGSVGIRNIINRLCFYNISKECFKIWSKVNIGTIVIVHIPLEGDNGNV